MPLEPLDGRIAVALEGQPIDLDDACSFFPEGEGDVQVCHMTIPPNEKYVLLADVLNSLTDESETVREAGRLIDLVNGVLFLEDARRQPIVSQGIHHRQAANGNWGVTIAMSTGTARGRSTASSGTREPGEPTRQALLVQKALNNQTVMDVLNQLRLIPDWTDLFKARELMQADISRRLGKGGQQKIGWPKGRVDTFEKDAQLFRHSRPRWRGRDPASAMPIGQARALVQELCSKWLASLQ
jgi:hypothetical protein